MKPHVAMRQSHQLPLLLFQMHGLLLQCVVLVTGVYVRPRQFLVEEWRVGRDEPRDSMLSAKREQEQLRRAQ